MEKFDLYKWERKWIPPISLPLVLIQTREMYHYLSVPSFSLQIFLFKHSDRVSHFEVGVGLAAGGSRGTCVGICPKLVSAEQR